MLQNWCSTTAVLFRVVRAELSREASERAIYFGVYRLTWLVARRFLNVTRFNVVGPVLSIGDHVSITVRVALSVCATRFLVKRQTRA